MDDAARPGSLGEAIRGRRLELGWSQEELADRITDKGEVCRQSDVSRLERGRVGLPRRARLECLASALGLEVGDLLARSGWAGAELAFRPAPGSAASLAEEQPAVMVAPVINRARASKDRVVDKNRLQVAMEQAANTRRRADDVLAQAAATMAMAHQPRAQGGNPFVMTEVAHHGGWMRFGPAGSVEDEHTIQGLEANHLNEGGDEDQVTEDGPWYWSETEPA